jgi:hypothetical protein
MKILKRLAVLWLVMFMAIGMFGCDSDNAETRAEYSAISYTKPIAVGDIDAYAREVSIDNKKNNAPLENGIVLCPYYTLKVNGKEVPVISFCHPQVTNFKGKRGHNELFEPLYREMLNIRKEFLKS